MSYNQPELSSCTQWNPDGITFADETIINFDPINVFVDRNNTVYAVDDYNDRIYIRHASSTIGTAIILDLGFNPFGIFVTINEEIYVGNEDTCEVERWLRNETKGIVVMHTATHCHGLFIDIANYLYCSLYHEHQIMKQSLNASTNMSTIVAGNSSSGSASNMLRYPQGIFVDINFDLYVADCGNNRVQLFKFGQRDGITVAGTARTLNVILKCPTAVFMDDDGCLFIVDRDNHRIVRLDLNGVYCVVGCSGTNGATSNQLNEPFDVAFDSYGNIFVVDSENDRIQKFNLITNGFGK